jgi:heptosyltransferase-3
MPGWQAVLAVALGTLGFFLPFSPAGVSVSLGALLVLGLVRARAIGHLAPWKEPVMAAGLALLAYIVAHTLWSTGLTARSWHAINRYHELLFAPLLFALMSNARHRLIFMRALLASAVLLALAHWVAFFVPSFAPMLESRRISAGFVLAVCAFLVLMRARGQARPWPARALAAFLALTVLLAMEGRTGLVVVIVLVSCAAWLHCPPRWRWAAAVASPLLVLAFAMSSDAMHTRIEETFAGTPPVVAGEKLSSTAIRIELLRVAGDLARRYAVMGAGFANYSTVHQQAARGMHSPEGSAAAYVQAHWPQISNPHNEYLMQLIGGGVVSLLLFLAWLGFTFREAIHARAQVSGPLGGMALAFAVGCLFNSMLLDFVEGHFYVAVLAWLLAENRFAPQQDRSSAGVERILVIATRQIGDVLLTTPLLRAARRRWPQARIEVLGFQGTLGMLRGNPDVDALIESPPRLGWRGLRNLVPKLWRRYDLALVTDPGDRAHLLGWLAASRRSGILPAAGGSNWWKKKLLDHVVIAAGDRGTVHVTAEKQSLLAPWLDLDGVVPEVVGPAPAPLPPHVQAQVMPGAVVVHAPSMWPYKQWPIAHFEALLNALLAQGRQVVLTGSAGERDRECIAPLRVLASPPQLLDLSGQLDFNQLATLLQGAALYIGPDTSVSHLAAASGVPVIAIFGPTNPMRWAPWPARAGAQELFARSAGVQRAGNVTVLQGSLACVPCGRAGCEDHRQSRSDCLVDIKPERVLEEAERILSQES